MIEVISALRRGIPAKLEELRNAPGHHQLSVYDLRLVSYPAISLAHVESDLQYGDRQMGGRGPSGGRVSSVQVRLRF